MESITGHRIDYNGVRALRGQRHAYPAKINPSTPSPPPCRLTDIIGPVNQIKLQVWTNKRDACRSYK